MFKTIGKNIIFAAALLGSVSTVHASCEAFEAEAEAFEGVVPRFDDNGSLVSISMYGEGGFAVDKRSLRKNARRKAELSARRAYSEWLNSSFSASTVAASLVAEAQQTDQDGNTSASVEELEEVLDVMRNDTASVMSGVIKLDECVDPEEKYLMVRMGWKPAFSKAAGDASVTMSESVERGRGGNSAAKSSTAPKSKATPASGYRKKSSLADDF
jgi:hypothetical protein